MPKNAEQHTTKHTAHKAAPSHPAEPTAAEELHHQSTDSPPELVEALKQTLSQYDFNGIGFVQESNNNKFIRMKMFDSEVNVDGKSYPCKVLVQFQIAREQADQVAA